MSISTDIIYISIYMYLHEHSSNKFAGKGWVEIAHTYTAHTYTESTHIYRNRLRNRHGHA